MSSEPWLCLRLEPSWLLAAAFATTQLWCCRSMHMWIWLEAMPVASFLPVLLSCTVAAYSKGINHNNCNVTIIGKKRRGRVGIIFLRVLNFCVIWTKIFKAHSSTTCFYSSSTFTRFRITLRKWRKWISYLYEYQWNFCNISFYLMQSLQSSFHKIFCVCCANLVAR